MNVEINVPDYCVGDILSNVSGKRGGRVIGIRSVKARFLDDKE